MCLLVVPLLLAVSISHAQPNNFSYQISGVYTYGELLTQLCQEGFCRLALPRDFYELTVPVAIYETNFDDAFKSLAAQASSDGWTLTKSGKKFPYSVKAVPLVEDQAAYISCLDSTVKLVPSRHLRMYIRADSLKCMRAVPPDTTRPPISLDRYRINFYVVTSSYLDNVGIDWTSIWAKGDLFNLPDLITDWTFQAVASGDTSAEFRSVELDIDSVAALHWGSQKKEETATVLTDGIVKTSFEYHDYGLTLALTRSEAGGIRGEYKLAQRDDLNSIIEGNFGGGGGDSVSTYGVFDSYRYAEHGVPLLKEIPVLGYLFKNYSYDKTKSFFVIEIVRLAKLPQDSPAHFEVLDSLKAKEWVYVIQDTTQTVADSVSDTQDKEVVDDAPEVHQELDR